MNDIKHLSQSERRRYWLDHVSSFQRSGLSQREFCRNHNISYWSFNTWKRRLEEKGKKNQIQEISPLVVRELSDQNSNLEIQFNETIRISVPVNFSEETLRRILHVLVTQT